MLRTSLNVAYMAMAGIIVVGIFLVFLVYKPMLNTLSQTHVTIAETQKTLAEREEFVRSINAKTLELEQSQADEKLLAAALPKIDGEEDVLRIVHQAASISGSTIASMRNQSTQEKRNVNAQAASSGTGKTSAENVTPLSMEIIVQGNYQQIRQFMGFLERSIRLIDIMSVDIKQGTLGSPDSLAATLTVRFYKQNEVPIPIDQSL